MFAIPYYFNKNILVRDITKLSGYPRILKDTYARAPVNWGKMNDTLWSNLDNAVSGRLSEHSKFCDSLSAKVKLLEDSIYEEAVLIFGHPLTKEIKLSVKSRRTIQSIKLSEGYYKTKWLPT